VAGARVARDAHALVCKAEGCGILAVLDRNLADSEARSRGGDKSIIRTVGGRCPSFKGPRGQIVLRPKTPALQRSIHAARNAADTFGHYHPHDDLNACARESCRVAAMIGGVAGAVGLCVSLARHLGMPTA
jgi:hypothetical protein